MGPWNGRRDLLAHQLHPEVQTQVRLLGERPDYRVVVFCVSKSSTMICACQTDICYKLSPLSALFYYPNEGKFSLKGKQSAAEESGL